MSKTTAGQIVDVTVQCADISYYRFLGDIGGLAVTGYFVDSMGLRTGPSFSLGLNAVGLGVSKSFADVPGGIPLDASASQMNQAVGAIVRFSGKVYFDLSISDSVDFTAHAVANYPFFGVSDGNVPLARINQV